MEDKEQLDDLINESCKTIQTTTTNQLLAVSKAVSKENELRESISELRQLRNAMNSYLDSITKFDEERFLKLYEVVYIKHKTEYWQKRIFRALDMKIAMKKIDIVSIIKHNLIAVLIGVVCIGIGWEANNLLKLNTAKNEVKAYYENIIQTKDEAYKTLLEDGTRIINRNYKEMEDKKIKKGKQ